MLANVEDLETFMGAVNWTGAQRSRAELVLASASALFVTYAGGQVLEEVTDETVTLDGTGSRVLLLPQVPVTGVESVTLDGELLEEGTDYRWSTKGILRRLGRDWPDEEGILVVVYSHGLPASEREDVRFAVLRAAARTMSNPAGASSQTIGGWSSGGTGVLMGADEIRVASRYQA